MMKLIKSRAAPLIVCITVLVMTSVATLAFAVDTTPLILDSTPQLQSASPGDGASVTTPNIHLSATVYDQDLIADTGYDLRLNGISVNPLFRYKGHWVNDYGGNQWIIDGYDLATLSATLSGLKDGPQNVQLITQDRVGHELAKTWIFNIKVNPTITQMYPAPNSTTNINSLIKVNISDNDHIDSSSIILTVDGQPVINPQYDPTTGLVTYSPILPLGDGPHTVTIQVKDLAGNQATASWNYTVLTNGPQLIFDDAEKTFTTGFPTIKILANSSVKLDSSKVSVSIDGQPRTATFTYRGHWSTPPYSEEEWVIDSYNDGTITSGPILLTDGIHTLVVSLQDILGNTTTGTWSFNVNAKPLFTQPFPAPGSLSSSNYISLKVADNDGIEPSSVTGQVDGISVPVTYDPQSGVITYQPPQGLGEGLRKITLGATDTTGNTASYTWSFTQQSTGPQLVFADADKTLDTHKPKLNVVLSSNIKIQDSVYSMKLDGVPVDATFIYKGHMYTPPYADRDEYVVDSYNEASLSYVSPSLSDGSHQLEVSAKDILGNSQTKTWTFQIAQKPIITPIHPQPGSTVNSKTPDISVSIKDPNGPSIDQSSIILSIDNTQIPHTVYQNLDQLNILAKSLPLTDDTFHTISLSVSDTTGNQAINQWSIYISSKGDVPMGPQACGSCHTLNQYGKYQHSKGPDQGYAGGSCGHCHASYEPQFCGYCHGGDPWTIYNGQTTADPTFQSDKACTFCHSPTPAIYDGVDSFKVVQNQVNTTIIPLSIESWNRLVHDLAPLHKINSTGCNKCHSLYLFREHNGTSKNGIQLNCATCHGPTATPQVKQAVMDKKRDCSACHTNAGHESIHLTLLDSNCQGCHNSTISSDHLANPLVTGNKVYNCDTCHGDSAANQVKRAISSNNLNCGGCHKDGHGVNFDDVSPADIPKYPGFRWTSPIEASIYAGEPTIPNGYEKGLLLLSNRLQGVNPEQIWDYYQLQLSALGWNLLTQPPTIVSPCLSMEYGKENRRLMIKCYNTETGSFLGPALDTGYRLEIWYL